MSKRGRDLCYPVKVLTRKRDDKRQPVRNETNHLRTSLKFWVLLEMEKTED